MLFLSLLFIYRCVAITPSKSCNETATVVRSIQRSENEKKHVTRSLTVLKCTEHTHTWRRYDTYYMRIICIKVPLAPLKMYYNISAWFAVHRLYGDDDVVCPCAPRST